MNNTCPKCRDIALETQFVYCVDCLISAAYTYIQPHNECEDAESSNESSLQKSKKREKKSLEFDEEISSKKLKKNSFLYSFNEEEKPYDSYTRAQPLSRSVWTGTFNVWHNESIYRKIDSFRAHLSTKACEKARNAAAELKPLIHFEMLPKSSVWPKRFHKSGPSVDDIAVYFFASVMKHGSVYDSMVFEMIRDDLAMRTFVESSELLVFTSVELPSRFRRFQGEFYLWGVFRGKRASMEV